MMMGLPKLSLLGRSALLLVAELLANAICWTVAGILFGRTKATQPVLSLALLAWTFGLRHALDADHIRFSLPICAIDNATRGLISLGQLPVTCGLFFSLGHSTIVVVVTAAIAISSDVYERLNGVGTVGGIVGAAVSGSFLFLIAVANSIILWRIIRNRRRADKGRQEPQDDKETRTLMMRILGPIVQFVDRPWKMYPVGILFGFGFDTASSIALLAISAIAKKNTEGENIKPGDIVILPLLFTAGMTLVDSADSILMLYSYAGFPERSWKLFEQPQRPTTSTQDPEAGGQVTQGAEAQVRGNSPGDTTILPEKAISGEGEDVKVVQVDGTSTPLENDHDHPSPVPSATSPDLSKDEIVKRNVMSGLSIVLTLMSILVAFSISLITLMSLIGEECSRCREAAEAEDGGGLAGSWWRGWANAADNSGFIGATIVGGCVLIVCGWYGGRWALRKWKKSDG
ncbi:NicO-domain-containing protein [Pluteus cervinus]|uniref:NicO-domain-containing protein n=1 Tax=Pluteus cervinus TaxID=181527 RepID=A0ACD3BA96_9AGAR|nr:NicO-domain-containing protein [Pluteus cervinus]